MGRSGGSRSARKASAGTGSSVPTAEAVLTADDLAIGYAAPRSPPRVVAAGVTVALAEGELVCLLGPNGAGKSTLVRTLAGMQPALAGRVLLDGDDVHRMPARQRARRLAVVLTDGLPGGLLTAWDLVALGRYPHTGWSGRLTADDRDAVAAALARVGAADLAHRPLGDLSDGERQKALIARALAQEPRVMILDEVTAFLDLPRRVQVMRLLRRLAHETGRAVLVSTHDLDLALRSADRLWLLPKGGPSEGSRLFAGAPEDLVLSGAFESAFAAEDVTFDRASGAFRVHRDDAGEVALAGGGVEAFWTRRALERQGLRVREDGGAALRVDVTGGGAAVRWRLTRVGDTRDGDTREFDTLEALTGFLRSGT